MESFQGPTETSHSDYPQSSINDSLKRCCVLVDSMLLLMSETVIKAENDPSGLVDRDLLCILSIH